MSVLRTPIQLADALSEHVLARTMNSTAHGMAESRLIFDPSPERDSLFECLRDEAYDEATTYVVPIATVNRNQMRETRFASGFADGLIVDLRDYGRNGNAASGPTARQLAALLSHPLSRLLEAPAAPGPRHALTGLLRLVSPAALLKSAVLHHLGSEAKAQALRDFIASQNRSAAPARNGDGAEAHEGMDRALRT